MELQAFAQFGADLDKETKLQLEKGKRIIEILKQPQNSPFKVEQQVVIIYLAINNYLLDVEVEKVKEFQGEFINFVGQKYPQIYQSIIDTGDLTDETESLLIEAVNEFKSSFLRVGEKNGNSQH